jgi:hypothetical protein
MDPADFQWFQKLLPSSSIDTTIDVRGRPNTYYKLSNIMPWGYNKRLRSEDFETCGDCSDAIDMEEEEFDVCGDCEKMLCSECCGSFSCDFCKQLEDSGGTPSTAERSTCCETCVVTCEDCIAAEGEDGDYPIFHKCCLVEHLKNCSQKSRTQRKISAANQTITEKTAALAEAKQHLSRAQREVQTIEQALANAQTEKMAAEAELKSEAA